MPRPDPDEFALIAKYFAPLARSSPGSLGLLDDAALLDAETGRTLVVAADMAVEGVHFAEDDPPSTVGRKVLRFNLSDLAAMGAVPIAYLLTLALPKERSIDWVAALAEGLALDQDAFKITLIGGDTTATPGPATLSVTVLGSVEAGGALLRSGAKPGDAVFVSGTIGDGGLGLRASKGELLGASASDRQYLEGRYRLPEPRLSLGQALVGTATAAIDVSDGLVADLGHVCRTSNVGAVIEAARVPLSHQAERTASNCGVPLGSLLTGGDDYELLFCLPEHRLDITDDLTRAGDIRITRIGRIIEGDGVQVVDEDGKAMTLESEGYRHF